ncbi:MAG: RNA polymerase sigma factor [Bacteroidota bacterium]|nr:RNA polymerase sigma factor [Bacteroidota bacterium]
MPHTPDEFLQLLQPHYNHALQYCRALCHHPDDAHDLLQQSLVQALEKLPGLRDPAKFKSWYFKIITRTFYRQCRLKFWQRFLPLPATVPESGTEMLRVFPESEDPVNERKSCLLHALAQLKPKERAALLLFELGNFTISEIAEIQEENSLSAVKSRLSRTRQKVKELILAAEKNNVSTQNYTGDLTDETEKLAAAFSGRR